MAHVSEAPHLGSMAASMDLRSPLWCRLSCSAPSRAAGSIWQSWCSVTQEGPAMLAFISPGHSCCQGRKGVMSTCSRTPGTP